MNTREWELLMEGIATIVGAIDELSRRVTHWPTCPQQYDTGAGCECRHITVELGGRSPQ